MPSLWLPSSWSQRLAELTSPSGELAAAPLRRDVRSLGMLLGTVLREQAAPGIYEAVEALRKSARARREDDDEEPPVGSAGSDDGPHDPASVLVSVLDSVQARRRTHCTPINSRVPSRSTSS